MSTKYPTIQNIGRLLEAVQAEYDRQVSVAEYFRKKCEEFRKDTEIQRLEEELRKVHRLSLHKMDEAEYEMNKEFRKFHYEKCKNGSTFQYELTGTGIGTVISVMCPICGERKDITSFDNW